MRAQEITRRLERLFMNQGAPAVLYCGALSFSLQVILCPLSALSSRSRPEGTHPLGGRCSDRFLLFCRCDEGVENLQPGDALCCGGERYIVEDSEMVTLSGRPIYLQASCRRELKEGMRVEAR